MNPCTCPPICSRCAAAAHTLLHAPAFRCLDCGDTLPAHVTEMRCSACEEDAAIDWRDYLNRERETVSAQLARWRLEATVSGVPF